MNLPLERYYDPSFSIVDRYSIYPTAMSLGTAEEHRTRRHTREDGAGGTGSPEISEREINTNSKGLMPHITLEAK